MSKKDTPNLLYLDIETTQILGKSWVAYDTNLTRVIRPSYILSFAVAKNDESIKVHKLPDYKTFRKDHRDDTALMEELRNYLNWADVVIAHNGDGFDLKKIRTRLLINGLFPSSPYETIDTLKLCRSIFGFPINKLDFVCRLLGIGRKLPHLGLDMWDECEDNPKNVKIWTMLAKYNAHDIYLLRELYKKIRAWAPNIPNMNAISGNKDQCPRCSSFNTIKNGYRMKLKTRTSKRYQRHLCHQCGHYWIGDIIKNDE